MVRGEAWGNLYLCDKAERRAVQRGRRGVGGRCWRGGRRSRSRTRATTRAASAAASELERAVRRLEATTAIARAVGGETDLDRILELIVDRGQALIEADGLVILLRETGGMVVAAEAGEVPCRIRDPLGLAAAGGVLVPLVFRGESLGMLVAFGELRRRRERVLAPGVRRQRRDRGRDRPAGRGEPAARGDPRRRGGTAAVGARAARRHAAGARRPADAAGGGGAQRRPRAPARRRAATRWRASTRRSTDCAGSSASCGPPRSTSSGSPPRSRAWPSRAADRGPIDVSADVRLRRTRYSPELETGIYRDRPGGVDQRDPSRRRHRA